MTRSPTTGRGDDVRHRRREPALPVADGGGHDRGGASRHGGGPYAGAAVEFLALAVRLAGLTAAASGSSCRSRSSGRTTRRRSAPTSPASQISRGRGGRPASVTSMPQSTSARWVSSGRRTGRHRHGDGVWTGVVTDRLGIPELERSRLACAGTLGERAEINANFRDEYYALVPAVHEGGDGPPLVTSGLIDPGVCLWGQRPMTFARRTFTRPRVDLTQLTGRFPKWAERKLVPKVLVANQTRILEAVADPAWRVAAGCSGQHRDAGDRHHVGRRDRSGADLAGGIGAGVATGGRHRPVHDVDAGRAVAARPAAVAGRRPLAAQPPPSPKETSRAAGRRSPRRTRSTGATAEPLLAWWRSQLPSRP